MGFKLPDGDYSINLTISNGKVTSFEVNPLTALHISELLALLASTLIENLLALCIKLPEGGWRQHRVIGAGGKDIDVRSVCETLLKPIRLSYHSYHPSVYLLRSETHPGLTKIGQSKYPFKRRAQLKGEILWLIPCLTSDPEELEITLHNLFTYTGKHVTGEWFRLDDRDIEFVKKLKVPINPFSDLGRFKSGVWDKNDLVAKMDADKILKKYMEE